MYLSVTNRRSVLGRVIREVRYCSSKPKVSALVATLLCIIVVTTVWQTFPTPLLVLDETGEMKYCNPSHSPVRHAPVPRRLHRETPEHRTQTTTIILIFCERDMLALYKAMQSWMLRGDHLTLLVVSRFDECESLARVAQNLGFSFSRSWCTRSIGGKWHQHIGLHQSVFYLARPRAAPSLDVIQSIWQFPTRLIEREVAGFFGVRCHGDEDVLATVFTALSTSSWGTNPVFFNTSRMGRQDTDALVWLGNIDAMAMREWRTPLVHIVIVTYRRPKSLRRLLRSLHNAYFLGDKVLCTVAIEAESDEETRLIVRDFAETWAHGHCMIKARTTQGGLVNAVTESWYPSSFDEYGVVLEDDIELSPWFYIWIKQALLAYRYGSMHGSSGQLFGVSLYTPRLMELLSPWRTWNPDSLFLHSSYLHQLPCSWGSVVFPEVWVDFLAYLRTRMKGRADEVCVSSVLRSDWSDSSHRRPSVSNLWGEASWKRFFIEYVVFRGLVMLYPNYPEQRSFSTNHLELGMHQSPSDGATLFTVPLIQNASDLFKLLPPLDQLPVVGLFNMDTSLQQLRQQALSIEAWPCLC